MKSYEIDRQSPPDLVRATESIDLYNRVYSNENRSVKNYLYSIDNLNDKRSSIFTEKII